MPTARSKREGTRDTKKEKKLERLGESRFKSRQEVIQETGELS